MTNLAKHKQNKTGVRFCFCFVEFPPFRHLIRIISQQGNNIGADGACANATPSIAAAAAPTVPTTRIIPLSDVSQAPEPGAYNAVFFGQ
jgi:hypothetical protein